MLAMTALNAEMQQLQKKYANNRAKLNEEIQALYERRGVSPMSGCLPQFIPLPIMMGLYYAVQQPLQYIVGLSSETVIKLAQLVGLDNLAGCKLHRTDRDRGKAERIQGCSRQFRARRSQVPRRRREHLPDGLQLFRP